VVLEDEARMIGRVSIPQPMRNTLSSSPIAILDVSIDERIRNVLEDYVIALSGAYCARDGMDVGMTAFYDHHRQAILRVQKRLGGDNTTRVLSMLDTAFQSMRDTNDLSGFESYIAFLLERYYDPMYDYQISKKTDRIQYQGNADEVIAWVKSKDLIEA